MRLPLINVGVTCLAFCILPDYCGAVRSASLAYYNEIQNRLKEAAPGSPEVERWEPSAPAAPKHSGRATPVKPPTDASSSKVPRSLPATPVGVPHAENAAPLTPLDSSSPSSASQSVSTAPVGEPHDERGTQVRPPPETSKPEALPPLPSIPADLSRSQEATPAKAEAEPKHSAETAAATGAQVQKSHSENQAVAPEQKRSPFWNRVIVLTTLISSAVAALVCSVAAVYHSEHEPAEQADPQASEAERNSSATAPAEKPEAAAVEPAGPKPLQQPHGQQSANKRPPCLADDLQRVPAWLAAGLILDATAGVYFVLYLIAHLGPRPSPITSLLIASALVAMLVVLLRSLHSRVRGPDAAKPLTPCEKLAADSRSGAIDEQLHWAGLVTGVTVVELVVVHCFVVIFFPQDRLTGLGLAAWTVLLSFVVWAKHAWELSQGKATTPGKSAFAEVKVMGDAKLTLKSSPHGNNDLMVGGTILCYGFVLLVGMWHFVGNVRGQIGSDAPLDTNSLTAAIH